MEEFVTFAHALADAAGAIIRPYFEAGVAVESKADKTPVTQADREAEAAMRALIEARYPDHAIYGEEYGEKGRLGAGEEKKDTVTPAQAGAHAILHGMRHGMDPRLRGDDSTTIYTWVLDPIDGTRAFIAGRKEWGTLIALCADGVPVLGVLDQPVTGERWVGVRGRASTFNGAPMRVRTCTDLAYAEFSTTSADYFTPAQATRIVTLAESCRAVVRDGDCYAYGLLALGRRDLVIDVGLKPYDILALVPIIEGAEGVITAWDGAAVTLQHFATAVATGNQTLHCAAQAVLTTHP